RGARPRAGATSGRLTQIKDWTGASLSSMGPVTTADSSQDRRLTPRGARTRAKIVSAAAELMYVRGVAATTLDDVVAASAVSKSQLYHHFNGKDALVRAVVDHTGQRIMEREQNA